MSKIDKLILKILVGNSDNNIKFDELYNLLLYLGFEVRKKGSHNIFRKDGLSAIINLQEDGSMAKNYQVRQVRRILIENNLFKDIDV